MLTIFFRASELRDVEAQREESVGDASHRIKFRRSKKRPSVISTQKGILRRRLWWDRLRSEYRSLPKSACWSSRGGPQWSTLKSPEIILDGSQSSSITIVTERDRWRRVSGLHPRNAPNIRRRGSFYQENFSRDDWDRRQVLLSQDKEWLRLCPSINSMRWLSLGFLRYIFSSLLFDRLSSLTFFYFQGLQSVFWLRQHFKGVIRGNKEFEAKSQIFWPSWRPLKWIWARRWLNVLRP